MEPLPAPLPKDDPGYLHGNREVWADGLRVVASSIWLPWVMIKRPEAVSLWAPMLAIPVLTLLAALAARFNIFESGRRLAVALVDVVLLTYVVWALGSVTTPVIVFFVMVVLGTTMTSRYQHGLAVAAAVIACYGAVLFLEWRGLIPVAPLARRELLPHQTSGGRIFAFISVSVVVIGSYGFLSFMRRRLVASAERERELRLAEQAAQAKALELQRQLELAQRMESMGRLAGGVAHDFNNLLTVIHGAFSFGLSEEGVDAETKEALEDGLSASRRASKLVQQLLAFSRRQPMRPQVLDPGELVRHVRRMLERVIGEDVRMAVELPADLGHVHIDPTQLEQVLLNLAVNARDALPKGGQLSITARNLELAAADCEGQPDTRPGRFVEIAVTDNGIGMSEDTRQRAVEPFFTTKPQGRGTGLGLATTFGILQQNGGWMVLESVLGKGTTVRIVLPKNDAAAAPLPHEEHPDVRGSETVLLVEDEESLRRIARKTLERSGYKVLEAASGEHAIVEAGRHGPGIQLLVTDLVMPGLTGKALAELMRKERPHLKVLYMSGYSPDQETLLAHGAHFLPKPFEPDQLTLQVRRLLDAT